MVELKSISPVPKGYARAIYFNEDTMVVEDRFLRSDIVAIGVSRDGFPVMLDICSDGLFEDPTNCSNFLCLEFYENGDTTEKLEAMAKEKFGKK